MLMLLSRWFKPVVAPQDYGPLQYVFLWLLVATGAVIRFWGLDDVGLHGDEDIMALAAKGVLEHGVPLLPSEAVYARSPIHTHIIAGSMYVFGVSEWAIRFPSALIGSLCGILAFLMGKRFLAPKYNLAFVVLMTFLPSMIEISQTGRMYIFLVACLLGFCGLLFRWESTHRVDHLVLAFLVWLLAVQFHSLAIFAAPLFLFPGLINQSWPRVIQGATAFGIGLVAFYGIDRSASLRYPDEAEKIQPLINVVREPQSALIGEIWQFPAVIAVIALSIFLYFRIPVPKQRISLASPFLFITCGVAACLFLHYHLAGIFILLGLILWLRVRPGDYRFALMVIATILLILVLQLAFLYSSGEFQGRQYIGALVGTPSIWPTLRIGEFTPVGAATYAFVLGYAAWRFSRGDRLPDHLLFFLMAVWAPLLAIGIFDWNPARRYLIGLVPFFLLCLLAGVSYFLSDTKLQERICAKPTVLYPLFLGFVLITLGGAGARSLGMTHPVLMAVHASEYPTSYPDHKGAADFIKSLTPSPEDIIIAEDSINQTYYLDRVDFRLLDENVASVHSFVLDGVLRGQYTGTPILGTGAQFEQLLDVENTKGQIYVIGSGESSYRDEPSLSRGSGIHEVLQSNSLEVIYEGRDGRTLVWRKRR